MTHFMSCAVIECYNDFQLPFITVRSKTLVRSGAQCRVSVHRFCLSVTELIIRLQVLL